MIFKPKHIPNILSGYRLLTFPIIIWCIVVSNRPLYVCLLCINLITDILDGYLARKFKWESELGARLDSIADFGTFIAGLTGLIFFEKEFVNAHLNDLLLIGLFFFLPQLICIVRFKRNISMHLYSTKITGYLQGAFFFTYFVFGYSAWYFYFMMIVSCINCIEELIILSTVSELRSNMKGLFWVIKSRK